MEARRNILVKGIQMQMMNQRFQGDQQLDAVTLEEYNQSLSQESYYLKM